jgi:hypothetical protein
MTQILLILMGVLAGVLASVTVMRRRGRQALIESTHTQTIFERVAAVGRLVGLEVRAKEIATSRKGWGWLPPILLSQARLAMVFQFEKQYSIDLARLRPGDVEQVKPGRYRVSLPPIDGALRLTDVTPYDIQAGRMLGLLDIIQVDAPTQTDLMRAAQAQAAALYESNEGRYLAEAERSIERHLHTLLGLFSVKVEFAWPAGRERASAEARAEPVSV